MSRKSHNAKRKLTQVSTGTNGCAYHFTDTIHLPWIFESGELQVERGAVGNYPTKFVWATTLQNGDRTCSALGNDQAAFKQGWHLHVRFTFPSDEFEPWRNIKDHPDWTPELFNELDQLGRSKGGVPKQWMVRPTPMPVRKAIAIETRTYKGDWEPLPEFGITKYNDTPTVRGIVINGWVYLAALVENDRGAIAYMVVPAQLAS
jgi:hypothetical protein